ncbi:hypothetical protein H671_7g17890 [Cricetulus griseus]|nr:hypothetical protein H671_7g17890 [Cricetulus griseus]
MQAGAMAEGYRGNTKAAGLERKKQTSHEEGYKLVHMVDYIDRFSNVEPSLHPGDEAYFFMVDDFSDMFLDSVCQYFIEYFCI